MNTDQEQTSVKSVVLEGLYRVHFKTQLGEGAGVVYLHDGRLHGGDDGFFYVGSYSLEAKAFQLEVQAVRHATWPGARSIFGVDHARLKLNGTYSANSGEVKGAAIQIPGVTLTASLRWLSG